MDVDDEYDNDGGLEMYEKRDKKTSAAGQPTPPFLTLLSPILPLKPHNVSHKKSSREAENRPITVYRFLR